MIASLVVVKSAGVSWFGIYSFIFILTTLASAILSTMLHRQMLLEISTLEVDERRRVFLATLIMQGVVLLIAVGIVLLVVSLPDEHTTIANYRTEIVMASLFVCVYNFYDLCRQYLYATDNQIFSFRCTAIYVGSLFLGLLWILFNVEAERTVATVYYAFSISLAISLISNQICRSDVSAAQWLGWRYVWSVFAQFFSQGRYRLMGLFVTWTQNQSMNPFLMWVSGPLAAGYFSLARLLVMPMAVINQGLVNSTTPTLRRIFKNETLDNLVQKISSLNRKNMAFSALYLVVLAIAHYSGLMDRFVPDYAEVRWYLLIWIATLLVTMYRFWLGQYFVVSMQFQFMMHVGIAALVVSLSGMVVMGYWLGNVHLALLFVIAGELVTIGLFLRKRRQELAESG